MYQLHFSIDDVIGSLRWAYKNEPKSIFDMRFWGTLKRWHEKYGLRVNLYLFTDNGTDFNIQKLQSQYVEEILEQKEWLRIAYHGVYGKGYINDEKLFIKQCRDISELFEGGLATEVRLHCWQASENELAYIKKSGVKSLLCPMENSREYIYNLTQKERLSLYENGNFMKDNLHYVITDVRFDFIEDISIVTRMMKKKGTIYIFLHEWRFDSQREIIEMLLEWLGREDIEYL